MTGADGTRYTALTDNYGDFWFEGLEDGLFELGIETRRKARIFPTLDTTMGDVNLGDIPLP